MKGGMDKLTIQRKRKRSLKMADGPQGTCSLVCFVLLFVFCFGIYASELAILL